MFEPKDVFQVTLTVGDRSADGKTDVTVEGSARLPVFGVVSVPPVTLNVPVDQVVGVLDVAVAAFPPAVAAAAKGLLALVKGALRH